MVAYGFSVLPDLSPVLKRDFYLYDTPFHSRFKTGLMPTKMGGYQIYIFGTIYSNHRINFDTNQDKVIRHKRKRNMSGGQYSSKYS